jgi:hypothetical protein
MNSDNPKPTCMHCGKFIADTSAPARFCSQACFDTLLGKVKSQWDQRFREAKANGNGAGNGLKAPTPPKHKLPADLLDRLRAVHGIQPTPSLKRRNW